MSVIVVNEDCPCEGCLYHTYGRDYIHWCKKKNQSISQTYNTSAHTYGQWLIPCGNFMPLYEGCEVGWFDVSNIL